jgi:hypothetical protein
MDTGLNTRSTRFLPMRLLATAGLIVGFVTGLALNFKGESPSRATKGKSQLAAAPDYLRPTDGVAVEYAPIAQED